MTEFDLTNADWGKIDQYTIHELENQDRPTFSYSGTSAGFIQEMLRKGNFNLEARASFLIKIVDVDAWKRKTIPGLICYSNIGTIIAANGNFEAVLALAKDPNVITLEASRPVPFDDDD